MTAPTPNRQYDLQKARSILLRLARTDLDVPMIRRLARALADPVTLRALAPMDQITCRLVSQLDGVPERFRTSGVFSVLNHLELSRVFWRRLENRLTLIPPDLRGSIEARLRRAHSRGAFFDAVSAAWEYGRENVPFDIQSIDEIDARLMLLDSPAAINREARRMKNCLASYRFLPQDGQVAYAAWWGAEPATVELIWRARKWRLGKVRGWKNKTISALTQSEIERAVNAWVTATGRPRISKSRPLQFVLRRRSKLHETILPCFPINSARNWRQYGASRSDVISHTASSSMGTAISNMHPIPGGTLIFAKSARTATFQKWRTV
jgi:hypothetical protein